MIALNSDEILESKPEKKDCQDLCPPDSCPQEQESVIQNNSFAKEIDNQINKPDDLPIYFEQEITNEQDSCNSDKIAEKNDQNDQNAFEFQTDLISENKDLKQQDVESFNTKQKILKENNEQTSNKASSIANETVTYREILIKTLISCFCVYHIIGIFLWDSPASRLRDTLLVYFRPYIRGLGLWQNWEVFAPEPKDFNTWLTAKVKFADGTDTIWEFPRMDRYDVLTRTYKERYRKWAHDQVNDPEMKDIWPDACRYIGRICSDKYQKNVVEVSISRHWTYIAPPDGQILPPDKIPGDYTLCTIKFNSQDIMSVIENK